MNPVVVVTCECGNKLDVEILPRLKASKHPDDPKTYSTLMGRSICPGCGREVWVRGYVEIYEKGYFENLDEETQNRREKERTNPY